MIDRYCYLRNGAFYWRWPECVWLLDRSLAGVQRQLAFGD